MSTVPTTPAEPTDVQIIALAGGNDGEPESATFQFDCQELVMMVRQQLHAWSASPPQTVPVQQALTDHVPGIMRCAKCKFRLTRVSLNVNVGTLTAGDNAPEHCPNGCGPMWPVSWRQEAEENRDLVESFFDRAIAAEKALADLQSRLGPRHPAPPQAEALKEGS